LWLVSSRGPSDRELQPVGAGTKLCTHAELDPVGKVGRGVHVHDCGGEPARLTVNGQPIDGTLVSYAAPGERVEVRVDL
jgi:hypothetical protein